jgi:hypothetical protein
MALAVVGALGPAFDHHQVKCTRWRAIRSLRARSMHRRCLDHACLGHHRVNIGGTVIVTAAGCEELNHIPTSVTYEQ